MISSCINLIKLNQNNMFVLIGLEPDGIIGHSVGELGCAYADGSFTAEEVVKAAYWRGKNTS